MPNPCKLTQTFLGPCGRFNVFVSVACWVIGYQLGNATIVGCLGYIQISISFMYQMSIFNDIPNKYEIIGAIAVGVGELSFTFQQLYIYKKESTEHINVVSDSDLSDVKDQITNRKVCASIYRQYLSNERFHPSGFRFSIDMIQRREKVCISIIL